MRKHDNSDAYFTVQNETVLQRVDYDNFEDKKPFRLSNSSVKNSSSRQRPIQLDIDVEINESLQQFLYSHNSTDTDLIDVTLIRETPSHPETTVSLEKPEVKRFLEMVSRNQDVRDFIHKARNRRSKTEQRRAFYKSCSPSTTDDESRPTECVSCDFEVDQKTDSVYTDLSDKTYENAYQFNRHEKVYASPDMFSKMRSSLACQHSRKRSGDNQKPGTPCLCQHCGMIGVLIESQKRPYIPHPKLPAMQQQQQRSHSEYRRGRKSFTARPTTREYSSNRQIHQESYNATQPELLPKETLFEDLLSKLKSLEQRLLAQEEKAVGKDYFQYVIRKMLSQYISKMVQSELPDNVKSSATQYSRILLDDNEIGRHKGRRHRHRRRQSSSGRSTRDSSIARNVKPEDKNDSLEPEATQYSRQSKTKNVRYVDEAPQFCKRKHWKDIRTEQDLKDRILSLIEGEGSPKKDRAPETLARPAADKEIKTESFQNTVCLPQVIRSGGMLLEQEKDKDRSVTTSALKDLLDNMSSQIYEDLMKSKNSKVEPPKCPHNMQKALDDTLFKRNIEASKQREIQSAKHYRREDEKLNKSAQAHSSRIDGHRNLLENLDVKYLSPVADIWDESSNAEFVKPKRRQNIDKADNLILQKDSLTYKIEYLKGLARSKNINEDDLWRSIWRQTKNRFKSKNDILTISIPSRKRTRRPIELELTWSDLREIMRSTRSKSSHEVSSSYLLHNQKTKRECNLYQNEYTRKNHSYKQRSKSVK